MEIYSRHILIGDTFQSGTLVFDDKIRGFLPGDKPETTKDGADRLAEQKDLAKEAEACLGDLTDCFIIPGLIDIHTHAAMGADASDGDPDGLLDMSLFYASHGVTSFCPTTMTLKEPELTKACRTIRDFRRPAGGAKCAGVNLEGPFVSEEKRGAQNRDCIHLPDIELLKRLNEASGGHVKLVTVAPETEGGIAFVKEASKICRVSLGHTMADYETAVRAFDAGAGHVTHLYNAMPPLHHRMPGLIGAAFDCGATVELISDGLHVHPSAVRMAERLFSGRLVLISDSLRCTGMPDGDYMFGGQMITLKNKKATLKGTDTLAGSVISLMEGVRRAVSFGIAPEQAILAASRTPARVIGKEDEIGSLNEGSCADIVALDRNWNIVKVWIDGTDQRLSL